MQENQINCSHKHELYGQSDFDHNFAQVLIILTQVKLNLYFQFICCCTHILGSVYIKFYHIFHNYCYQPSRTWCCNLMFLYIDIDDKFLSMDILYKLCLTGSR